MIAIKGEILTGFQRVRREAFSLARDLFLPAGQLTSRWLDVAWLSGLYIAGILLWTEFFSGGNFPYTFQDWASIAMPRLIFLQNAVTHGQLPLHISLTSALGAVTDRYLSVPNTLLSPQMILLGLLDIGHYFLVNQLILYTVAFFGLLWFWKRFSLSLFAFTILFLLFNFNGHIVSHLSVGHASWEGTFFFPWFAALIFQLLDGDRSWSWVGKVSLVMLAIFLQGAFHQFIWLLMFLGLLALASWRNIVPIAKAGFFSALLSLFRLLPPTQLLSQFEQAYGYMGGYPDAGALFRSLVTLQKPGTYWTSRYFSYPIGTWEVDLYVGLAGALFILLFGVIFWLGRRGGGPRYRSLALPVAALALISFGDVFKVLHDAPLPFLHGERVASRIIIVPFTFLVLLAVIEFQRWLDRTRFSWPRTGILAGYLGLLAYNLHQHFVLWEVANSAAAFQKTLVDPAAWKVANHPDPAYYAIIAIGLAGTGAGLLILAYLVWKENRRKTEPALARESPWQAVPVRADEPAQNPAAGPALRRRVRAGAERATKSSWQPRQPARPEEDDPAEDRPEKGGR